MTSNTTKAIPLLVILLVAGVLSVETVCECAIDLEAYLPLLTAMGLGGIPLTVARNAIEAKKSIDVEKFKAVAKQD